MQAQECSCARAVILIKIGITPLAGDDEVEPSITIHIRQGDAATEQIGGYSYFLGYIVKAMVRSFNEKSSFVAAAYIVSGTKAWPQTRVADETVIGGSQRLKFRPAINLAFDKTKRLHDLKLATIIKVSHACVPSPAAAGDAELLTGLHVR